jgi:predicted transcriptional regulator of viral defense system
MKNEKTTRLDWSNILTSEARLTDVVQADKIALKYELPIASAGKALLRLAKRGLLSRVSDGIYVNKLVRDNSPLDFVNVLKRNSYVSLESALRHWGLSTQSPVVLTCVTPGRPNRYKTPEFAIQYRKISEELFWGFIEKRTRYGSYKIAESEKALLDWIYLSLQTGLTPYLDEIDFKPVDKRKLTNYAEKYPESVRDTLLHSLAFEHFAG